MKWYTRPLESGDLDAYMDFLGRRIDYVPVPSRYQWLYRQNPHGKALTWLAIHGRTEKIIGCTSVFPRRMWLRGRTALGSVGGDAFVDPSFRRRGIAKELHRLTLKGMRDAGIEFMYGFPVEANFGALLKAGSYHPGDFRWVRLLLTIEPVARRLGLGERLPRAVTALANGLISSYIHFKLSSRFRNRGRLVKIAEFDRRFDRLLEESISTFGICCFRDRDYLNWRYFKNPMRAQTVLCYEEKKDLHGFAALEFLGSRCVLFDFYVRHEDAIVESFLCALIHYTLSIGSSLITAKLNPNGPYMRSFLRCGFRVGNGSSGTALILLTGKIKDKLGPLKQLQNWYLTHADSDSETTYIQ